MGNRTVYFRPVFVPAPFILLELVAVLEEEDGGEPSDSVLRANVAVHGAVNLADLDAF